MNSRKTKPAKVKVLSIHSDYWAELQLIADQEENGNLPNLIDKIVNRFAEKKIRMKKRTTLFNLNQAINATKNNRQ
jgi:hypothetical protein